MSLIVLIIVVLVCMMLTVTIYQKRWNIELNTIVLFEQQQVNEGETVTLVERIENRKLLPLPTLTVKFQLDRSLTYVQKENTSRTDRQYRNDCITVMSYQRVTRKFDVICTKRGFFRVDNVDLVAMDLLFQNILATKVENHTWLYVYPARSRFLELSNIFNRLYGECLTNRFIQEDPFEFKGIRDYTPSDSIHRINWKASARTGSLKINQFYDTSSQQITIFLNVEQEGFLAQDDLVEESIRIVRNFIEWFVGKGIPVTLISNGRDIITNQEILLQEGAGASHIDHCLKQLARIDITKHPRKMEEVFQNLMEHQEYGEDKVTLLISSNQSQELGEAYAKYVGTKGNASWLIPIHASMEHYIQETVGEERVRGSKKTYIHTEYLVMEQII